MASACADRLQVGEVVSTIPSAHLAALTLPSELVLLPLTVPVTDKVCCATAIGFNVETVTYKNIKFQAGHPALHMLACIAALNAPSWLGQAVDQHCALGVAAGALRWRRMPKRVCPAG